MIPIDNKSFSDSVYTERLMGSYKDNFQGYRNASLIENAEGLRHKKYMIIHGLLDDKVNFLHSAMLSKELQHKAILFRQQVLVLYIYMSSLEVVFCRLELMYIIITR